MTEKDERAGGDRCSAGKGTIAKNATSEEVSRVVKDELVVMVVVVVAIFGIKAQRSDLKIVKMKPSGNEKKVLQWEISRLLQSTSE